MMFIIPGAKIKNINFIKACFPNATFVVYNPLGFC